MEKKDWEKIKGVLKKNYYATSFGFLGLVVLLFILFNLTEFYLWSEIIQGLVSLLPIGFWIFLFVSLCFSAVAAYYEKYYLMLIPIMIWILSTNIYVRSSNIPDLINVATGEPVLGPDLDPFLFLRNAEEIQAGSLEKIDSMRYPGLNVPSYAYGNLMPWVIVGVYKVMSIFSSPTMTEAANITPVVLATFATIGFFFFMFVLFSFTLSKRNAGILAVIGSLFYICIPQMIHRTTGGIPEIEGLGMVFFWLAFGFFLLSLKDKIDKKRILYGILAGLSTGLMSWSWGGYRYLYMIFGLSALIIFFLNKDRKQILITYSSWIVPAIIIEYLKVWSLSSIITGFTDTGFGLFVLLILIIDYLLYEKSFIKKIKLNKIKLPDRIISLLVTLVFSVVFLLIIKPEFVIRLIPVIIEGLLYPFGRSRVGLTIAENKTPYMNEVMQTFGKMFWAFLIGTIVIFYECVKNFDWKRKCALISAFIFLLISLFFSRISQSHQVLNGETFFSHALYLGGILIFTGVLVYIYLQAFYKKEESVLEKFKSIDSTLIVLLATAFWMTISLRGAIRLLFLVSPFVIIIGLFLLIKFISYYSGKEKDSIVKGIFGLASLGLIILLISTFVVYFSSTVYMTAAIVPSQYHQQWQYAMDWVETNTPEEAIFVHWWDYGYWVQTLGKRATVTDGGHFTAYWDHLIGRYLLTTPYPEQALSLLKSYNVSYLLIDSSDLGKYSAYSSIGDGFNKSDRLSWIPAFPMDPSQTRETAEKMSVVYQAGTYLDDDLIYELDGKNILLPKGKAILAGVVMDVMQTTNLMEFEQPVGVFFYNNNYYRIPIRNLEFDGHFQDFKEGIDATVKIIPSLSVVSGRVSANPIGAVIYLSPKVAPGLFAKLYLMNDPLEEYSTLKLAKVEDDFLIKSLKMQGMDLGEFVYYQGFRGPIKIWDTREIPENILIREEFLNMDGEYGALDELEFTR